MTTTEEQVPVSRLDLVINPDNQIRMRSVALGIPGAVGVVLELEATEEMLVPGFVLKVEAGGIPGVQGDRDRARFIAEILDTAAQYIREYADEEVTA